MGTKNILTTAGRTSLSPEVQKFLHDNPYLHLGTDSGFHAERSHHLEVFGIHGLPKDKIHSMCDVDFTAIRGPHKITQGCTWSATGSFPLQTTFSLAGHRRPTSTLAPACNQTPT